jgi:hypothetical protein
MSQARLYRSHAKAETPTGRVWTRPRPLGGEGASGVAAQHKNNGPALGAFRSLNMRYKVIFLNTRNTNRACWLASNKLPIASRHSVRSLEVVMACSALRVLIVEDEPLLGMELEEVVNLGGSRGDRMRDQQYKRNRLCGSSVAATCFR